MGAKAVAARKGAMIPSSPKGKTKKKTVDDGNNHEIPGTNAIITGAAPPAAITTDNTTAVVKNSQTTDIEGEGEAQGDQELEHEAGNSPQREADAPKINAAEHAKVSHPARHRTNTILHKLLVLLVVMNNVPQLYPSNRQLPSYKDNTYMQRSFFLKLIPKTKQGANRTRCELSHTQTKTHPAFVPWENPAQSLSNTCLPQEFRIETAARDRPRAKFLNITTILNGICVHLGLSNNALADTRGFAVHGDPRNGTLNVVIPPHYWERLDKALAKDGVGFTFRSVLPKDADCVDRTPVTFYARRASDNAIMRGSQKNPKPKLPWNSFEVPPLFLSMPHKACVALQNNLEALGFTIPSTPRLSRDERGTYSNLLHAKFTGYPKKAAEIDWVNWSRFAQGMPVLCGGLTHHCKVRGFDGGFLRTVLLAKEKCFHNVDQYCLCGTKEEPRRGKASSSSSALKDTILQELGEIAALEDEGNFFYVLARMKKRKTLTRKRDFARPQVYQIWDSTLGYPGEGPSIKFASANLRGGVNSKHRWTSTLRAFSSSRIDLVAIQEHNLRKDAKSLNSIHFLANAHGFVFLLSPLPTWKRVGGVGILVRQELYASLENLRFRSHRTGGLCSLSFRVHAINMKFASVYAPADPKERVSFFRSIRCSVDENTILCGDFNCVDDPSLDTRRSSNLNYSNDGADILRDIVSQNSLTDEIREQNGLEFEFTHSQKTPSGGYCLSRLDRHYLPDFSNCQWTSEISDKIDDTDHSIVITTLTTIGAKEIKKGNDLYTINSQVIHLPEVRELLIKEINKTSIFHKNNPTKVHQTVGAFKYTIRSILKKATRVHAKQTNTDIGKIDELLELLHISQIRKPTAEGAATRTRLIESRIELKKQLSAPKPQTSYFVYKKSELMSRQFWQATFPKTTKAFNGIMKLCKVVDWSNPPPKNTDTGEYSESISNEAARYYSYLYQKPPTTEEETKASEKLYKLLEEGDGVDYSTSKLAGEPIKIEEINKTMSNLPDFKSPGPDRITNEFYKTFAKLLAPLYCDYYNYSKIHGLSKGFADGIISVLYKKGAREDIRNYRPITLLNTDYKILTRILAKRTLTLATQF
eukprot:4751207-Pleurochrysis_carterae.AAC.1